MMPSLGGCFVRFCLVSALGWVFLGSPPLFAQTPQVQVNLVAKRVTVDQGKEVLVLADKAKPGDVIQYEALYRNTGATPVRQVGAVVPIPTGLALIESTTSPEAVEASLDGKTFRSIPLTRPVPNEAGVMEDQPVPLAKYRALRWNLPEVPAGGSVTVTLRARVTTNGPPR